MNAATATPRRWGFRARLAVLIATVFIVAGASLLGVQYALVHQLLSTGIANLVTACALATPGTAPEPSGSGRGTDECAPAFTEPTPSFTGAPSGTLQVATQQTFLLSQQVLSGLLVWSVVVLVAFAGLAMGAGWWLSKRSLGRIAQITTATRSLTQDDLHRRLGLPGPDDEIKELGDTIDGMLDRLDDAFTRQERFIASASHELRTPLTTARTALEIPLAQGRVPADIEPAIQRSLAANARSERLIAALLLLARQRPGVAPAVPADASADVSALVRLVLEDHEHDVRERGITVVRPIDQAQHVHVEPALAEVAIGNLIDNAVRHGAENGRLVVEIERDDDTVTLRFANDGPELSAEEVAHLVEPFNRGTATRLAGTGTGLGLTIVETIAHANGGTLTLAPRPGGGLVVELTLPAR